MRQPVTSGFAATWAGQTIFSSGSLPFFSYGLDRLLRQFILAFKFSFINLHHHGVRHSIKYPSCAKPRPLADIFMVHNFIIGIILLLVFAMTWHYIRLRRISKRHIKSEYSLKQVRFSLSWTQFILPTILLSIGFYGNDSLFMISLGASLLFSMIVEWLLNQRYVYDAFAISGDNLISNEFRLKTFNLQELTIIDFLPFSDSLQLKFQGGQSISIHRPDFDKDSLSTFFNKAIEKSKLYVVISDDAKTKISVS